MFSQFYHLSLSLIPDLSYMCCPARRGPQPCHRWLHSSPYARTQGTKRFNILSGSPHTSLYIHMYCLICCTRLRLFLTVLVFTTSPAVFDMYAGCSTLDEGWAVPEHDGQICTLLAAPQEDCRPPHPRAPPTLPVTEKQWTQSQVRAADCDPHMDSLRVPVTTRWEPSTPCILRCVTRQVNMDSVSHA